MHLFHVLLLICASISASPSLAPATNLTTAPAPATNVTTAPVTNVTAGDKLPTVPAPTTAPKKPNPADGLAPNNGDLPPITKDPSPVEDPSKQDPSQPVLDVPSDTEPVDGPVDKAPADKAPADKAPIDSTPIDSTPVDSTPVDKTPIDKTPSQDDPTQDAPSPSLPEKKKPGVSPPLIPAPHPHKPPTVDGGKCKTEGQMGCNDDGSFYMCNFNIRRKFECGPGTRCKQTAASLFCDYANRPAPDCDTHPAKDKPLPGLPDDSTIPSAGSDNSTLPNNGGNGTTHGPGGKKDKPARATLL